MMNTLFFFFLLLNDTKMRCYRPEDPDARKFFRKFFFLISCAVEKWRSGGVEKWRS
jgi:hypothetical protein